MLVITGKLIPKGKVYIYSNSAKNWEDISTAWERVATPWEVW